MTHVFVAPHPDDVALSCGGLIASLRETGQNVAILTLYSGSGAPDDLSTYQREALGFGSKSLWPVTEAFNRAHLEADYPTDDPAATPPWQATPSALDATQADADAAAKRFWQRSSWYRRANIHNESLAGQPIIDDVPAQGAVLTTELTEAAEAGEADGDAPPRGRAVRRVRRGLDRLARPPRRGLPRLRGRRPAAGRAAGRRPGPHRAPPPRDRCASSPSACTCRWASAATSTTS